MTNISQTVQQLLAAIEETDRKLEELKKLAANLVQKEEEDRFADLSDDTAAYATYRYYLDVHTSFWEVGLNEITIKKVSFRDGEIVVLWFCERDGDRIASIPVDLWLKYQKSWHEQNGYRDRIDYDEYLHYTTGYQPRW